MRVLEVFREPIAHGGQEMFLINMYRHMDHDKIQLDFLTPFTMDNPAFQKEVESYGGHIYAYGHPFGQKDNQAFRHALLDFLKTHHYDTIHIHSGSTYALMEGSRLARQSGARNVLVHSHCGGFANLKYYLIKTLSIPYLKHYPTLYLACSQLAARWKYPKSILQSGRVRIIKNAIDVDRFTYSPALRGETRQSLQLDDQLVIGHVGRFSLQKNHAFLLDVFASIHAKRPDAVLLLIGTGELEQEIKDKAAALQLEQAVRFLGLQEDIPAYLNAMDVFVLPSFFEGLPIAGVEAQACGLPVVTSTRVARELPLADLSHYLDLNAGPAFWADQIVSIAQTTRRCRQAEQMKAAGYSITEAAQDFQNLYLSLENPV